MLTSYHEDREENGCVIGGWGGGGGEGWGGPKYLRTCMGRRLNPTYIKLRILWSIMKRKHLFELNIKTSSCA